MPMNQKNRFLGEMHEIATDLYSVGAIDKTTMRHFDAACLLPEVPEYSADAIRGLREKYHISQAVLAAMINASTVTVQKWEHGSKKPGSMAMKLLNVLDRKGPEALL